jgi:hypothetical protein
MPLAGDFLIASDVGDLQDDASQKPLGRMVQSVAQTLTDAVFSAVTFTGADDIDTHAQHDPTTNPSRVTPTRAGYYRFTGTVWMATATTPVRTSIQFRKNNVGVAPTQEDAFNGRQHATPTVTALIACNGTTDYVELWGFQDSAGNINTFVSGAAASVVEWEYVRDL